MKHLILLFLALTLSARDLRSEIIFSQDFNDGRFGWSEGHSGLQPSFSARSGDLVVTQESRGLDEGTVLWASSEPRVLNSSTRIQASLDGGGNVAIMARANDTVNTWLQAGFNAVDDRLYLGHNDSSGYVGSFGLADFGFDFDTDGDLILQLDVFDETYSFSAWPAGDLPPQEPQITVVNDEVDVAEGVPGLQLVVDNSTPGEVATGTFRYILVADTPLIFGDFNMDQSIDARDIDDLSSHLRTETQHIEYDLNADGTVSDADREFWVWRLQNTYFGDANLDGEFNSADFVQVFQADEYEDGIEGNSGWASGDWNGDGEFDSSDFVLAFEAGGYDQGRRVELAAVPEPSTLQLFGLGVIAIFVTRWRNVKHFTHQDRCPGEGSR